MATTVRDILKAKGNDVFTIAPAASVYAALQLLAEKNIGALPVVQSDRIIGIFSERDYARNVVLKGKFSKDTAVQDVMTKEVITVTPDDNLEHCMGLMTEKHIRHLPVIDGQRLTGIISIGDIVKMIIADQKYMIGILEGYIVGNKA